MFKLLIKLFLQKDFKELFKLQFNPSSCDFSIFSIIIYRERILCSDV